MSTDWMINFPLLVCMVPALIKTIGFLLLCLSSSILKENFVWQL